MAVPHSLAEASELVFSAKEAEADIENREVRLRGDVEMTLDRYRLTSQELLVRELSEEIVLEGKARLGFCDCLRAPLTIGFERAAFHHAGDLKLTQPRLQIGGTTVLAVPWFWLRSPSQVGLLPPTIAFRGDDGLLLGGGVHLPWSEGEGALDLGLAGYTQGGFELTTTLATTYSATRLRWDRIRGDLVAIDALGSTSLAPRTALSWDIDAIRGARARSGTIDIEAAAEAYDRAAIESTTRLGQLWVATGMRAFAARGDTGPGSGYVVGPRLSLFSGNALGSSGEWDALATGEVLAAPQAVHLLRAESTLAFFARPGPFATRVSLRKSLMAWAGEAMRGLDGALLASADMGLPLVRDFGEGEASLVHLVEPRAELLGLLSSRNGADFDESSAKLAWDEGGAALASAGFRTALGPRFGASRASLDIALGTLASGETSRPSPLAAYRAAWNSRHLGLSFDGAATLGQGKAGHVAFGRARLGPLDGSRIAFEVAGREGFEPLAARLLTDSSPRRFSGGWLGWPGFGAGVDAETRLLRVFSLGAGADADLSERRLLGLYGHFGYKHSCNCLSANLYGQARLGRPGMDVWAGLQLIP